MMNEQAAGSDLMLMLGPAAEFVHALDRGVNDVLVAFWRKRNPLAEPLFLAQLEDLGESVALLRALVNEINTRGLEPPRCDVLYEAFTDGLSNRESVDWCTLDLLPVRANRGCCEASELSLWKVLMNTQLPLSAALWCASSNQ